MFHCRVEQFSWVHLHQVSAFPRDVFGVCTQVSLNVPSLNLTLLLGKVSALPLMQGAVSMDPLSLCDMEYPRDELSTPTGRTHFTLHSLKVLPLDTEQILGDPALYELAPADCILFCCKLPQLLQ